MATITVRDGRPGGGAAHFHAPDLDGFAEEIDEERSISMRKDL